MNKLWRIFKRYLDSHWRIMLGELLYCTPGALDPYIHIQFPSEMRLLAKLLS